MNKITKTLALTIAIVMMLIMTISASALDENTIIIKNIGSTKAPIFIMNDEVECLCINRDKKAPSKNGTEYTAVTSCSVGPVVEKILINYSTAERAEFSPVVAQYAVWGSLENELDSYKTLSVARFGEKAGAYFDSLFSKVPEGKYIVTVYGYHPTDNSSQDMISWKVEVVPEPTTEEPTTEPPTTEEPTTEPPTTEPPTTEEPTTEEPTTEEPTTEAPTEPVPVVEEPTKEPTTEEPTTEAPTEPVPVVEEPTETPTEPTTEYVINVAGYDEDNTTHSNPEEIPQTGGIAPIAFAIAALATGGILLKKKKH